MAYWIDSAQWPAHGRLWAHLISDVSYDDLHDFAATQGLPRRGFDRDHYDVPGEAVERLMAAGAVQVPSREIVSRLQAAGLRKRKAAAMARRRAGVELLRPARLRAGDLVGVFAPAGPILESRLDAGLGVLRDWGLEVTVAPHTFDTGGPGPLGYLAGSDQDRADDFAGLWMNDDVKAVIAGRGGYGTQRMLDLLDWRRMLEASPKILVGFSDLTALHQAVASRLGLVTVHGHLVVTLGGSEPHSVEMLRRLLFGLDIGDLFDGTGDTLQTLRPGTASGVLTGGNLAMLASEIGTEFSRSGRNGIVVLEDVDEEPFRIDRMLTHLIRVGWFDEVRAIVLGEFTDCGDEAELDAVLRDRLLPLDVPLVAGFAFGHTSDTASLPLGVAARLDAPDDGSRATLRLEGPAFAD